MKEKTQICTCTIIHQNVIDKALKKMPTHDELFQLAELYKNFADCTRVKILSALQISEMCVCDLATLFNMSISAVSHQLKVLRLSNLVKFRKDGKNVYYSLADDHVKSILNQGLCHVNEPSNN